ncbi:hypothetical protein NQ318_019258 [Aromia moschata]|uniref:Uncharacterized protein n=1 Tax=Aromia moschata TaxID=1265417 RepID=A0AAV8Z0H9_9CUCU|nr:hypothetical protein NQ318_019258 [Aromia moschata]
MTEVLLHEPEFLLPARGLKSSDDLRNLAWDEKNLFLPICRKDVSDLDTFLKHSKSHSCQTCVCKMPKQLNSCCQELVAYLIRYFEKERDGNRSLLPLAAVGKANKQKWIYRESAKCIRTTDIHTDSNL